jgi:predicted nucleic-acid-binding protein
LRVGLAVSVMLAVDTNVILRLIVEGDPEQMRAVRSLLRKETFWISKSVVLEMIWVLESFYKYDRATIHELFEILVGMPDLEVEDKPEVIEALDLISHGVDPADAMHLASTPHGTKFVSFDRDLVRTAKRAGTSNVAAI